MVKLRGNLTDKMEANPGKVHFRRWKAMSIGSRISLVVLILIVMIAVFANILAPHNPLEIFTARQAPDAQYMSFALFLAPLRACKPEFYYSVLLYKKYVNGTFPFDMSSTICFSSLM